MPQTARRLVPALALATALAACGTKEGAATGDSAAPATAAPAGAPAATASSGDASGELADIQRYQLSMDKIDKFIAAQRNIAAKAKAMTPAEREAMRARNEGNNDPNQSLDDMARKIESEPAMNDAIRSAGLSAREYAVLTMSMVQTAMADGVLKMRPKDNQDSLAREMKANPDNIKFYRQHEAEITAKMKAVEAEMKAAGSGEE